jgi:hypothetical protein
MFERDFASAEMTCLVEAIHETGDVVALEWRDPLGLRGCGFFTVRDGRIAFQRLLGQALLPQDAWPADRVRARQPFAGA